MATTSGIELAALNAAIAVGTSTSADRPVPMMIADQRELSPRFVIKPVVKRLEADGEDDGPDQEPYKRQEQLHAQGDQQREQEQRQGNVDDRPDAGSSDSLVSHVRCLRQLAIRVRRSGLGAAQTRSGSS